MKKTTYICPVTLTRTIESNNVLTHSATTEGGSNPPSYGGKGNGSDAAAKGGIWEKSSPWGE